LPPTTESFTVSSGIIAKIEKWVNYAIYMKEIDAKRIEYHAEYALYDSAETCYVIYNINHD
jgi:hypothetical protein